MKATDDYSAQSAPQRLVLPCESERALYPASLLLDVKRDTE